LLAGQVGNVWRDGLAMSRRVSTVILLIAAWALLAAIMTYVYMSAEHLSEERKLAAALRGGI
jgi:hypothetical protein